MRKIPEYKTYVNAYYKKAKQLAKRGYSMYDTLMSYSEYQVTYTALRNTRAEVVMAGERKANTNIMRDLINRQAYQFTRKQAIAQHTAAKQLGIKATIQNLMVGNEQLGNIIRDQRKLLLESGLTNKETELIISQEYFGSK